MLDEPGEHFPFNNLKAVNCDCLNVLFCFLPYFLFRKRYKKGYTNVNIWLHRLKKKN